MSRGVTGEHDRMLAAMIIPGKVVDVDLQNAKVRIESRGWVSPWVRWHSQGAGKARHWRAPSMNEQGSLECPSGVPALLWLWFAFTIGFMGARAVTLGLRARGDGWLVVDDNT